VTTLAVVLAVLLVVAGAVAFQQRTAASRLAAQNESRLIAAQADLLRASDPAIADQLSLTAYATAATPEARASLYASYAPPRTPACCPATPSRCSISPMSQTATLWSAPARITPSGFGT
jgi:Tfp pilus assembly protein PilX